jgi:hypothetical protein
MFFQSRCKGQSDQQRRIRLMEDVARCSSHTARRRNTPATLQTPRRKQANDFKSTDTNRAQKEHCKITQVLNTGCPKKIVPFLIFAQCVWRVV